MADVIRKKCVTFFSFLVLCSREFDPGKVDGAYDSSYSFPKYRSRIPEGNPGVDYAPDFGWVVGGVRIYCERAWKAVGFDKEVEGGKGWVGFEDSVADTVRVFERVYGEFL